MSLNIVMLSHYSRRDNDIAERWLNHRWSLIVATLVLAVTGCLKWNAGRLPSPGASLTQASPVPNAAPYFARAYHAICQSGVQPGVNRDAFKSRALALIHEGLKHQYLWSCETLFDNRVSGAMYPLACFLVSEGRICARKGNWKSAAEDDIDAIQIGCDDLRGRRIAYSSEALDCQDLGRRSIESVVGQLPPEVARAEALRLETIDDAEISPYDMVEDEKRATQAAMLKIFTGPRWSKTLIDSARFHGASDGMYKPFRGELPSPSLDRMLLQLESRRAVYEIYADFMDKEALWTRDRWLSHSGDAPALPGDIVCSQLITENEREAFAEGDYAYMDTKANNKLLEAELALQAYKSDHGAYPARLADLVPHDIRRVPDDPFNGNEPLVYRRAGSSYFLAAQMRPKRCS